MTLVSCLHLPQRGIAVAMLLVLASCGGGGGSGGTGGSDVGGTPASVVLAESETLVLHVGDVVPNPATAFGTGTLSYSSNNEAVATVDATGTVTAIASGSATITVNQEADADHPATSDSVLVNVLPDSVAMTAWLGKANTLLEFSAGLEGVAFYRSNDRNCDLANYASCSNGQRDTLDGTEVTDTAATSNRSAFYSFVIGDNLSQLHFTVEELPFRIDDRVIAFKGQLYAVGGSDSPSDSAGDDVWVSSDGIHWGLLTDAAAHTERKAVGIAVFDDKLWIAAGYEEDGTGFYNNETRDVWWSADGATWTRATASAAFGLRSAPKLIGFNGKLRLYGGYSIGSGDRQDAWSSTDGQTWSQDSADIGFVPAHVLDYNGKLYATSGSAIWSSADGTNWSQETAATGYSRADGFAVHAGDLWVVSHESSTVSETWKSPDGVNWTQQPVAQAFGKRYGFNLVSFGDRLLMLGGFGGFASAVKDHWSFENNLWQRAMPGAAFRARYRHCAVSFNDKLWVIAGKGYGNAYLNDAWSSSDGISWTQETAAAAFSGRDAQQVVAYGGKLWLYGGTNAGGNLSDVWSSADGATWVAESADPMLGERRDYGLIEFNGTLWLLGGIKTGDNSYTNEVWHSTDGTAWTQDVASNFPTRARMGLTVFNGKLWMLAGESAFNAYQNDAWYSSDGVNWTQATADAGFSSRAFPRAYAYGGRLYVNGGGVLDNPTTYSAWSDGIWSTADGVNWTQDNENPVYGWRFHNPVVELNGALWMLGSSEDDAAFDKGVWRSTDGATWRRPMVVEVASP